MPPFHPAVAPEETSRGLKSKAHRRYGEIAGGVQVNESGTTVAGHVTVNHGTGSTPYHHDLIGREFVAFSLDLDTEVVTALCYRDVNIKVDVGAGQKRIGSPANKVEVRAVSGTIAGGSAVVGGGITGVLLTEASRVQFQPSASVTEAQRGWDVTPTSPVGTADDRP